MQPPPPRPPVGKHSRECGHKGGVEQHHELVKGASPAGMPPPPSSLVRFDREVYAGFRLPPLMAVSLRRYTTPTDQYKPSLKGNAVTPFMTAAEVPKPYIE